MLGKLFGAKSFGVVIRTSLSNADLIAAALREADLRGATGITNEQLKQQASSLEGATMLNGQKYEEWLMTRGEGGENTGSS
jgi:hypothetical protein